MLYDIVEKHNHQVICGCHTIKQAMRKIDSLTPCGLKRKDWRFEWRAVNALTYRDPPYIPKNQSGNKESWEESP